MKVERMSVVYHASPNARYIGRPSVFRNPFPLLTESARDEVLEQFAVYWYSPKQKWLREKALTELTEETVLLCFCSPKKCHGDIIAGYLEWKRGTNG